MEDNRTRLHGAHALVGHAGDVLGRLVVGRLRGVRGHLLADLLANTLASIDR